MKKSFILLCAAEHNRLVSSPHRKFTFNRKMNVIVNDVELIIESVSEIRFYHRQEYICMAIEFIHFVLHKIRLIMEQKSGFCGYSFTLISIHWAGNCHKLYHSHRPGQVIVRNSIDQKNRKRLHNKTKKNSRSSTNY